LDLPEIAKPGQRVKFSGFEGEPVSSSVIAKKKIYESLAPCFNTNSEGICCFKDIPFTISGETIRAKIKNGVVS
jgi:hypothetical protein